MKRMLAAVWVIGVIAGYAIAVELEAIRGLIWRDNGARPGDPSWGGRRG